MTQGGTGLVNMWQSKGIEFKDVGATSNGMTGLGISDGQGGKYRQKEYFELGRTEYLQW